MWTVMESPRAKKNVDKLPKKIGERYEAWRDLVRRSGPHVLPQVPAFHDHPLKGSWKGCRASCLDGRHGKWRIIYKIFAEKVLVDVFDVNAHDYRPRF